MGSIYTEEIVNVTIGRYISGENVKQIVKEVGITLPTLYKWLKIRNIPLRREISSESKTSLGNKESATEKPIAFPLSRKKASTTRKDAQVVRRTEAFRDSMIFETIPTTCKIRDEEVLSLIERFKKALFTCVANFEEQTKSKNPIIANGAKKKKEQALGLIQMISQARYDILNLNISVEERKKARETLERFALIYKQLKKDGKSIAKLCERV